MNPILNIKNLSLTLNKKLILNDLSFDVQQGQFISIIGPNGAGKSSLIKCLCQIYTNWMGYINLAGKSLKTVPPKEQAKRISYVPQATTPPLPFSVFNFVLMGRYPHLSPFSSITPQDKQRTIEMLNLIGLESFANREMNTLSGGERQLIFIAAALMQETDIILLDEPTAFLDYRHKAEVESLLKRLNEQQNKTIVSVSHDINTACARSSQILALKKGAIHFYGTPRQLLNIQQLEELYHTPFHLIPRHNELSLAVQPSV